jgi:hypothetical protein
MIAMKHYPRLYEVGAEALLPDTHGVSGGTDHPDRHTHHPAAYSFSCARERIAL